MDAWRRLFISASFRVFCGMGKGAGSSRTPPNRGSERSEPGDREENGNREICGYRVRESAGRPNAHKGARVN